METSSIQLRAARSDDFEFAWGLYKELMKPLTEELLGQWNEPGQQQVVRTALSEKGSSIILESGSDVGWMQVIESPETLYLAQLYVSPSSQGRGIGTAVLHELAGKARESSKTLTLDVMKNNRSRLLYERSGFQIIGQTEYKLKMRWTDTAQSENQ